jgi:carboxylate-amine ligase
MTEQQHSSKRTDSATRTDGGKPIRRSIEVEYWVIDEDGRLTEPGSLVEAPGAEREFVEPLLEIKTTPCETTAQLREELYGRLGRVLARAETEGKALVPLATPLHSQSVEDLPHERTRIQNRVVGETFECVRHCAGTHIHFEQLPGSEIDQLNTLTALDPALALVSSSPYYRGSRLAASARSEIYRWKAYESLPNQGQLWSYAEDTEQWARRLRRRYEEFVTQAIVAGVDRDEVESYFTPESAVWTPVKLRADFATVEWRSPDTALPSQVLQLAEQLAGIVERIDGAEVRIDGREGNVTGEEIVLPEFDVVQELVQTGIRTGLSSPALRSYLDRMGFDLSAFTPLSRGFEDRGRLTVDDARRLRLEHADSLREDVAVENAIGAD